MSPLELYKSGPTDLTWEEENSSNLLFKGDYLDKIDISYSKFIKKQEETKKSSLKEKKEKKSKKR